LLDRVPVIGPLLQQAGRMERQLLAGLAIVGVFLFGFLSIAEEVVEGETHRFDRALLLALRNPADPTDPIGPRWLEEMMRDFTALGGTGVLVLLTLGVATFLWMTRRSHAALFVVGSIATGLLLSSLLKFGFDRPRPDLVPHGSIVYTKSFPSGHSMLSAIVYLSLALLLARTQSNVRVKAYLIAAGIFLTALVGVSRVYLGVHWPTDVLAGWSLGMAWALGSWLAMAWLQSRQAVEPPDGIDDDG
jgi:undecaprenyl-diphosphatase